MNIEEKFEILWDDYKNEELSRFRIINDEKWNGTIFHYDIVSFNDEDAVLTFSYDIQDKDPEELPDEDRADFESLIAEILEHIIREGLEAQIKEYENREDNSNPPDS